MNSPDIDIDAVLASKPPLSNLPTPRAHEPQTSEVEILIKVEGEGSGQFPIANALAAHELLALLPSNLRYHPIPNYDTILIYLERVAFPGEFIGLAACILGNITNSFVRSWRQELFYANVKLRRSECIVLAALCIAAAFLSDTRSSAIAWLRYGTKQNIHSGRWPSTREFSTAVRCILAEINWEIHAFTPDMIFEALQELRNGGTTSPATMTWSPPSSPIKLSSSPPERNVESPLPESSDTGCEWACNLRGGGDVHVEDTLDENTTTERLLEPLRASMPSELICMGQSVQEEKKRDSGYGGVAIWAEGVLTPEPTPQPDAMREEPPRFLRLL